MGRRSGNTVAWKLYCRHPVLDTDLTLTVGNTDLKPRWSEKPTPVPTNLGRVKNCPRTLGSNDAPPQPRVVRSGLHSYSPQHRSAHTWDQNMSISLPPKNPQTLSKSLSKSVPLIETLFIQRYSTHGSLWGLLMVYPLTCTQHATMDSLSKCSSDYGHVQGTTN